MFMMARFILDTFFVIVMVQKSYLKAKNVSNGNIFRYPKPFQFCHINREGMIECKHVVKKFPYIFAHTK